MDPGEETQIRGLAEAIRSKAPRTNSLFLALYERLPPTVWPEAVRLGILTEGEFVACMLLLKQYRRIQTVDAIEKAFS